MFGKCREFWDCIVGWGFSRTRMQCRRKQAGQCSGSVAPKKLKLYLPLRDRICHRRHRENSEGSWGSFSAMPALTHCSRVLTTSLFLNRLRLIRGNILFRPNILIISKWFNFEDSFYFRQPDPIHLLDSVLPLESSLQPDLKFFTDCQVL